MKKEYYELTAPQKSIWLTEQYYKNTNINNVCGTFYSDECLDFEILKKAINTFLQNNDSFKIKLHFTEDKISQYFSSLNYIDFKVININTKQEQTALEKKLSSKVFSMLDSLLFEIVLFRYPDNHGGFIINSHHIISDSWTNGIVANDVALIYSKIKNNESYKKDIFLSYKNYISSEENYVKSDKFQKDKEYWNDLFTTIPEVATIPSIKDNSKNQNDLAAKRLLVNIDEKLLISLNSYCERNKVSLYNFFMTIFSLYLGRVSNLDEFVIGTPILNRTNFKEKQTTGMFINTLPLKVTLSHKKTFLENLKDIAINSISLLRHQKYSYQYLIEDLRKRDSNLPKLYNIIFSYQITKMNENMDSLEHTTSWNFNNTIADDLDIHMFEWNENNSIQIAYDYRINKYDEHDILDLHARILHIINQVLEKEDILLKDIEIVTPEEKHKILYEFNNTSVDYPKDKTIVDLFEEQVEKTPDNIAVVFEGQQLTYRELNEKANQLARYLISNGIKQKSVIGLRMDKCLEMIIGIISIIKAGCCYLPINMSYPQDRVNYMLEDSSSSILLTTSNCNLNVNVPVYNIDLNNKSIYSGNLNNLNQLISTEDLIYIIYTSGSTGKPKGAMLCHRNIVRLMKNDNYLFDFNESDIWTMFHSVAFDFSVWEMYGALLYGGKLILVPDYIGKDPKLFLDLLRKYKVTILNQTPSYFYNLQDVECNLSNKDLFVRYIIFGGEALNPSLIQSWKEKYPLTKLINMYGITETAVHVTFKELERVDLNFPSSNIGKPIPTLKAYVLDKNLNLQPFNTTGQLCVAGEGLCLGYLNRPDLNMSKFVKNPYIKNETIYLSGDNACLSASGDLIYEGRIDNQFKLRGFRVELDEIESKILSHPSISKCVVLPKKIDNKDTQLIAYIVCNKNIAITQLKNYIYNLLPAYMIPSHFIKLDSIPLTSNGKTDRKKLLSIDITLDNDTSYVAPRNNFERDCISIIENCLNIKGIGIDHNLLDIGADSLTFMKISVDLLKKSYIINIQDFYEYKTIRNISDNLDFKNQKTSSELESITFDFDEAFSASNRTVHNILLTGSTGFLGAHLLYDLLKNSSCCIYCLVRNKNKKTAKERLLAKLNYYFENELDKYIDNRIKVIEGDIALENLGLSSEVYKDLSNTVDTVLHSAALVSHYGSSSIFKKMNVQGTNNIIHFCANSNIKLNYISTISVSGDFVAHRKETVNFDEHCLYIGQNCNDNIYTKTKFDAEKLVIQSIIDKKISASIYRLGNITARYSDLKFQENNSDNAFVNRMNSLLTLGVFPESYLDRIVDFSPVDYCSRIINKISLHSNCDNKIFHIFNNHTLQVSTLLELLKDYNYDIKILSNADFLKYVSQSPSNKNELGIINDITSKQLNVHNNIKINSDFTNKFMEHLNLTWPTINTSYILKFLKGDR